MKGQYLTLEYALYFAIGVGVIIATYYLFSNINQSFEADTTEYQLKMVGELITGTAINILEVSNSSNSTIYYNLSIPAKLSRCIYSISIDNGKLKIYCTNVVRNNIVFAASPMGQTRVGTDLTLYNFNIQTKNNIVIYSTSGLIKMKAKGGEVDLE